MVDAVTMEPARPEDEPALRRLLRQTPFAGAVSLSLEREPDFHLAASVEGDRHEVVVGRAPGGEVVGVATRSVRTAFVNGAPARVGYLGTLRAALSHRGRVRALRDGFALLAETRLDDELPFDLTSIVADNVPARRLLEAGLPGFPTYRPLGDLVTLALVPRRARPARRPAAFLTRGAPGLLPGVAAFLRGEGARRQFAPCPTAEELASPERSRGLAPADWWLAERDGRLLGVAALWDQRAFKQAVVRGYAPALRAARPLLALAAPLLKLPRLPPVGEPLRAAFLAHLAVANDDPAVAGLLLDAALGEAAARGLDQLLLGLAADHPLLPLAARRLHRPYRSTLYAVHDAAGGAAAAALDRRVLGPEVATL